MGCKLVVYTDREREYYGASWAKVQKALDEVAGFGNHEPSDSYAYLILEADNPPEGCVYVQSARSCGDPEQTLEARIVSGKAFRHYHLDTTDQALILDVFKAYYEGGVPDVSGWEDWTSQHPGGNQ